MGIRITVDHDDDRALAHAWAARHDDVAHLHVGSQRVIIGLVTTGHAPMAVQPRSNDLHADLDAAMRSATAEYHGAC